MYYYKDKRNVVLWEEAVDGSIIEEEWRDVVGFEGFYQVSSFGRIRSCNRAVNGRRYMGKVLSQTICKSTGYCMIALFKEGMQHTNAVHILIGRAFLDNPENKAEINHKKGNKKDNRIWMIEWSTRNENIQHSYNELNRQAPWKGKFGKDHNVSKPISQYTLNGGLIAKYESQREAALKTGIGYRQINACVNGRQKTAHGYIWQNS